MNALEWLGPRYLFLTDYDIDIMPTWSLLTKQEMLQILITAKKTYQKEDPLRTSGKSGNILSNMQP